MEHIKFLMDEKRRLQDNMDGIYNIINDLENDIENYQLEAEEVDTTIKYLDRLIKDEKTKQCCERVDYMSDGRPILRFANIGPKVQYGLHSVPCVNLGRSDSLERSIRLISGIDDVEFDTLKEAQEFRELLCKHISKEGPLSVCKFKTLLGLPIRNIIETRYGWTKGDNIFITLKTDGNFLKERGGQKRYKILMPMLAKIRDEKFNKIKTLDDGWYSVGVGESYLGSLGIIEELKRLFKTYGCLSVWDFKKVVGIEATDWLEQKYGWKNIDRMFVSSNITIKADGARTSEYYINMPPFGFLD